MRSLLIFVLLLAVSGLSAQLSAEERRATAHMEPFAIFVSAQKAKEIQAIQGPNLVIIDVRTPRETANGKINGAIEVDIKSPGYEEKLAKLDKTKQYMVYCYAGGLSNHAFETMKKLGFKQLYCMTDGYKAYKVAATAQ